MIRADVANRNDPLAGLDDVRWDLAWDCDRDVDQVPMLLRLLWQGDREAAGQLRDRLALLGPIGYHLSPATPVPRTTPEATTPVAHMFCSGRRGLMDDWIFACS